jgi:hypothetical protein
MLEYRTVPHFDDMSDVRLIRLAPSFTPKRIVTNPAGKLWKDVARTVYLEPDCVAVLILGWPISIIVIEIFMQPAIKLCVSNYMYYWI